MSVLRLDRLMKGGDYSPAKKAKACKNVVMRMMAVVLVYSYALILKRVCGCIRVLTRNKRGGIIGARSVYTSQKADSTIKTPPTTNRTMVAGEFPRRETILPLMRVLQTVSRSLTARFALIEA